MVSAAVSLPCQSFLFRTFSGHFGNQQVLVKKRILCYNMLYIPLSRMFPYIPRQFPLFSDGEFAFVPMIVPLCRDSMAGAFNLSRRKHRFSGSGSPGDHRYTNRRCTEAYFVIRYSTPVMRRKGMMLMMSGSKATWHFGL